MTQEALLFLVILSSPRGHVQGGLLEHEGHVEQIPTALQTNGQPVGAQPSE